MNVAPDLQQIILFFAFVAPGFLFTRTYLAYRPRYYKESSLFEQIALALIGSAAIHATLLGAVAIGAFTTWALTKQTYTLTYLAGFNVPIADIPLHILAIFLFFTAGYLVLSLIVARRAGIVLGQRGPSTNPRSWKWWTRLFGENPPENLLLWYTILQQEALQKGILRPKLTVHLRNGDRFEGYLNRLKLVGDEDNSIELAITEASCYPAAGSSPIILTDQIVLLQSKDILWLSRIDTIGSSPTSTIATDAQTS